MTVADLIDVLEQQLPGFRTQFDDAMINIAVNNEMLLHRAGDRTLTDGDIVEIVPAIAGERVFLFTGLARALTTTLNDALSPCDFGRATKISSVRS